MAQTSYSTGVGPAIQGQMADQTLASVRSFLAETDLPFGVGLVKGAADNTCKLPGTAADVFEGASLSSFAHANASLAGTLGVPAKDTADVLARGTMWVTAESAVDPTQPVYCRYAANGGNTQLGSFRKDADGAFQVATLTPTAVNATLYTVNVNGRVYTFTSSGAATPTNIVAGLTAALNADTSLPVVPSGTTTLILTAKVMGVPFSVTADANQAVVATTANAASCFAVPRARWLSTALAGALAILELSVP